MCVRTISGWTLAVLLLIVAAIPASAETQLLESSPGAGEVLGGPLAQLWMRFDAPVPATSDTFAVRHQSGEPAAFSAAVIDTVVTLTFDPPLPSGRYRLEWGLDRDGRLRRGVLPFEVIVEGVSGLPAADAPTASGSPLPELLVTAPPPETSDALETAASDEGAANPLLAVDGFLDGIITWERLSELGRIIGDASVLLVVGALAFLGFVLQGRADEVSRTTRWVRHAAVGAALGLLLQVVASASGPGFAEPGSWRSLTAWSRSIDEVLAFRFALTLIGAVLVATINQRVGLYPVLDLRTSPGASTAPGTGTGQPSMPSLQVVERQRSDEWAFDLRSAPLPLAGAGLLLLAVALDAGVRHDQPDLLTVISLLHLAAAGIWFGVGMTALLVMGRRFLMRQHLDAPRLVGAASTTMVVAVAMTLLSGAGASLLTGGIGGDGPDSWSMAVKIGAGIAAGGLAVLNRKLLVPRLEHSTTQPSTTARALLTVEACFLATALITTAIVVA